jgi:hypothetical protein
MEYPLCFAGKPTKPRIAGPYKVNENSDVTLSCSSKPTSRPSYYASSVSLIYTWYRNNTALESETSSILKLPRVSKDITFNRYSCRAMESVASEKK